MIGQNNRLRRFLLRLTISISVLVFTVLAHHLSVEQVNNNSLLHFKLTQDLPSALAQGASPSPSPTRSPSPSPSPTPSPSSEQDQKKPLLNQQAILLVIALVLFVVSSLLIMLLSPIVGTRDKATLGQKGEFLSESFPNVLQGVTVLLIVMVVTLLSLVKVIDSQGTLSILSALIGYVLGRKASELEYKQPPGGSGSGATKPTELKIEPSNKQVKYEEKITIEIKPQQAVEVEIDPNVGEYKVISDSTIEYTAPSRSNAGDATQVIIKVNSKDNPFLKTAETTINLIP